MKLAHGRLALLAIAVAMAACPAPAASPAAPSRGQELLASAGEQGKFAFILFHKEKNAAGDAYARALDEMVAARPADTTWLAVNTSHPAEKALIDRFEVSRAPMPMVLAVAPNGAVTSVYTEKVTVDDLAGAIVSPCLAHCMKSMQDGKLVLLWVHPEGGQDLPPSVRGFTADAKYGKQTVVVTLLASQPAEAQFLADLEVDPATAGEAVLMAPPGVVVGKFGPRAAKAQMVTALKAASTSCPEGCNCQKCRKPQQGARTP
jgi:hypothetical protein